MTTSFIHPIIRRSNRNLLILCAAIALLLIGLAAFNARYLYNFFAGPLRIDRQTLLATTDPAALQRYWVTVEGDDVADTGFQQVRRNSDTGSENVAAAYMALLLDRRVLLVKDYNNTSATTFTGYIEPLPADARTRIIADIEQDAPKLRGAFLPYMLNTAGFRDGGYLALGHGHPAVRRMRVRHRPRDPAQSQPAEAPDHARAWPLRPARRHRRADRCRAAGRSPQG